VGDFRAAGKAGREKSTQEFYTHCTAYSLSHPGFNSADIRRAHLQPNIGGDSCTACHAHRHASNLIITKLLKAHAID